MDSNRPAATLLVNLDYKVTPDAILSLRTSYNYYNAPFHNRNWTFAAATTAASQPDAPSATSMRTIATNATDTTNTVTTAGTNFQIRRHLPDQSRVELEAQPHGHARRGDGLFAFLSVV